MQLPSPLRLAEVSWRPPPLKTERLLLRGYEPSDLRDIFAYASDPEVTRFMSWNRHESVADSQRFLDQWVARHYANRELDFAICERTAPHRVIGGIGLFWRSRNHGVMELGYVLSKAHWGQGYVPEAGRLLLRHGFETKPVWRIYAPIFRENDKSHRAAQKMGLTFEGVHRSALLLRGRRWDEAVYAILREEILDTAPTTG